MLVARGEKYEALPVCWSRIAAVCSLLPSVGRMWLRCCMRGEANPGVAG